VTAFADANLVIYAGGRESPYRAVCEDVLRTARRYPGSLVTDAEALPEVLHVYLRREGIGRARRALRYFVWAVGYNVMLVTADDVLAAAKADYPLGLQARDRIHLAVMDRLGIDTIISTDRGFDLVPGVRRLDPLALDRWRGEVFSAS